jgi:hypothetical protein
MYHTEKYATTCHFRVSPVSGKFTVAEYVCFVSPFGFEGLSLRLTGGGMTAFGSDALRALDISFSWGDKRIWKLRNPPSCCFCISFFLGGLNLFFVEEVISSHSTLGPNAEGSVFRYVRG